MKKSMWVAGFIAMFLGMIEGSFGAEVTLGPDLKIPPNYQPGSGGCQPGRG
jgi:hypothetical protein